jgi:hypothetical protein
MEVDKWLGVFLIDGILIEIVKHFERISTVVYLSMTCKKVHENMKDKFKISITDATKRGGSERIVYRCPILHNFGKCLKRVSHTIRHRGESIQPSLWISEENYSIESKNFMRLISKEEIFFDPYPIIRKIKQYTSGDYESLVSTTSFELEGSITQVIRDKYSCNNYYIHYNRTYDTVTIKKICRTLGSNMISMRELITSLLQSECVARVDSRILDRYSESRAVVRNYFTKEVDPKAHNSKKRGEQDTVDKSKETKKQKKLTDIFIVKIREV